MYLLQKCSENQKVFRCYDSHAGKLRKRRDSTRSGLSQTVVVGPIYAIEGAKGLSEMDIIAELRNHSDTYFESTFNNTGYYEHFLLACLEPWASGFCNLTFFYYHF